MVDSGTQVVVTGVGADQNLMISIARTCKLGDFECYWTFLGCWIAKELKVKIVFHPPYFKLCDIFTSAGI